MEVGRRREPKRRRAPPLLPRQTGRGPPSIGGAPPSSKQGPPLGLTRAPPEAPQALSHLQVSRGPPGLEAGRRRERGGGRAHARNGRPGAGGGVEGGGRRGGRGGDLRSSVAHFRWGGGEPRGSGRAARPPPTRRAAVGRRAGVRPAPRPVERGLKMYALGCPKQPSIVRRMGGDEIEEGRGGRGGEFSEIIFPRK